MTWDEVSRPRWLLRALLIVGAGLFVGGVAIERGGHHDSAKTSVELAGHDESTEQAHTEVSTSHTDSEEVLGINPEAPALIAVAVGVSLLLALIAWTTRRRPWLLAIAGFAVAFAVFDAAEVRHQIDSSRAGLAVLAAAIGVVHLATATASVAVGRVRPAT